MDSRIMKPEGIEKKSMEIISRELAWRGITCPRQNEKVIRRVIHATADFEFAGTLKFSPDAVRQGIKALRSGKIVVTDTNMALAGISRKGLERLGSRGICYMADEEVAARARALETTRAYVSMYKAADAFPDAVFAIGNAPTALFALSEQIRKGLRPSLIAAVPVGFVQVAEAKEEIFSLCGQAGIPVITAEGRKGGSSVAAAIMNALIYEALEQTKEEPGVNE